MFLTFLLAIFIISIIITKITCGRCSCKVSLIGKTILITGGNAGIGFQTALFLASRGCKIIIADRDDATESVKKIIEETNNKEIFYKHLDLSSFKSIRRFAKEIIATENRLDILINNAGIGETTQNYTEDGIQELMQINYFGPFLLTTLLIGLLKKSAPSRIIFVVSSLIFDNYLTVDNLNPSPNIRDRTILRSGLYGNSKFAALIAANKFAKILKGSGVTCNSLHPGGAKTGLFVKAYKSTKAIKYLLLEFIAPFYAKSPEDAAQTSIHLALANELKHVTGKYFMDCVEFRMPSKVKNKEFCEKIWQRTVELVKLENHEKLK